MKKIIIVSTLLVFIFLIFIYPFKSTIEVWKLDSNTRIIVAYQMRGLFLKSIDSGRIRIVYEENGFEKHRFDYGKALDSPLDVDFSINKLEGGVISVTEHNRRVSILFNIGEKTKSSYTR